MSPLSSTIVAPALPAIAAELDIRQPAVQQMVLSIFLLGFACGPLVASPLSEIYGRVRVVQTWNAMYIVFNAACGGAGKTDKEVFSQGNLLGAWVVRSR